jgi:hypothetical protein
MSQYQGLNKLHHLVQDYLRQHANSHRRPLLERKIRAEIKYLADVKEVDIETLTERDISFTESNILHVLNPNLSEEERRGPQLSLRLEPRRAIGLEVYKLQTLNVLNMSTQINQVLTQMDIDPEDLEMLLHLPQTTKDMATKLFFALQKMVPMNQRVTVPQEDIYTAGVRISRLILDNADNFMAFPKLGPGLGGPLGRGPAGKILEIIPDIISQMQFQENILHNQHAHPQPHIEAQIFHPTPRPTLNPAQLPGSE